MQNCDEMPGQAQFFLDSQLHNKKSQDDLCPKRSSERQTEEHRMPHQNKIKIRPVSSEPELTLCARSVRSTARGSARCTRKNFVYQTKSSATFNEDQICGSVERQEKQKNKAHRADCWASRGTKRKRTELGISRLRRHKIKRTASVSKDLLRESIEHLVNCGDGAVGLGCVCFLPLRQAASLFANFDGGFDRSHCACSCQAYTFSMSSKMEMDQQKPG